MPRNWKWGKKRKSGFRSGWEEQIARNLTEKGVGWEYEPEVLYYNKKILRGKCLRCGAKEVVKVGQYRYDFRLDNGTLIEAKGRLTSADRTKLLAVRASNRDRLLVILFKTDNKLGKNTTKRYSEWAGEHGWDYAVGAIPRRWLTKARTGKEIRRGESADL